MPDPHSVSSSSTVSRKSDKQAAPSRWIAVCSLDDIIPGTGVAALLENQQIAIIRPCNADAVYAMSNFDPFSKAFVISRGIIGDRAGVLKITSPIYKQSFDLRTGQCLDDASVSLPVYPTRVVSGQVEVQVGGGLEP